MKVTSENYNNKNNLSSSSLSSRDMDAMSVLNLEYKSMTSSQKNILDERIMEAEEEEENYKNERAKMKAMSHTSRTTTRTTSATRSITNDDQDEDEEEEVEVGWSLDEDALVQKLTRTYLFDFDAVAKEMNKDKKDIRLRFALLSSNNGVAPIAVPKKTAAKKITRKNVQSKTTSSNGSGGTIGGGSVRASYTPWSSESDDRSSGSGTAVMGITAPPQAPGNDSFNSKVMRILPVSVNLDALPSMMDSEEDSEEEEEDGNGLTTDVDAMD